MKPNSHYEDFQKLNIWNLYILAEPIQIMHSNHIKKIISSFNFWLVLVKIQIR